MTTREKPWLCGSCGHLCDAASSLVDDSLVPKDGDMSVCIGCAAPHQRRAGVWTPMQMEDLAQLTRGERKELNRTRRAVQTMLAVMGPPPGRPGGFV
jgi:hypothetical protein